MSKSISQLPATTIGLRTDLFEKVDGVTGESEKITGAQVASMVLQTAKVYRALLTQQASDAPEATVLENTLSGPIVWARSVAGIYTGTLAGAFLNDKTFLSISLGLGSPQALAYIEASSPPNIIRIVTTDITGASIDDALSFASVEVRTYT